MTFAVRPLPLLCALAVLPAAAQQPAATPESKVRSAPTQQERELRELNLKLLGLIDALVKSGALDEEVVKEFLRSTNEKIVEQYGPVQEQQTPADLEQPPAEDVIRVPYIPEFIKDEIREQVTQELTEEVTEKVVANAKQERWGVPAALPGWVDRITFSGDVRLRGQYNRFDDNNTGAIPNTNAINDGLNIESLSDDVLLDFTNDQDLARLRFRFDMTVEASDYVRLHTRLSTGNPDNPVSANWTLDSDSSSDFTLDRAYFEWFNRNEGVKLQGGLMANPHFTNSQLMWDNDYDFPGLSAEYWPLRFMRSPGAAPKVFEPYIRVGYFMLDKLDRDQTDKTFYSAQLGTRIHFNVSITWETAAAYYDFKNVTGVRNPVLDLGLTNDTAPDFVQKGNTLFQIQNSSTEGDVLLGLAAEFAVANISSTLTFDVTERHQLKLNLDYLKNVGFDKQSFLRNVGADPNGFANNPAGFVRFSEETDGYHIGMSYGDRELWEANHWLVSIGYRYLEKDAVLDAYTDSNFHLGGTDAQGYIGKFRYSFADRAAFSIRYISTDEIQGLTQDGLRIDVLQTDLEFKF